MLSEYFDVSPDILTLFIDYLLQWLHYEVALVHERMGNDQVGLVDVYVVVDKYIYVDNAVVISAVDRLCGASHLLFYCLGIIQYFPRRQCGDAFHGSIHKHVV